MFVLNEFNLVQNWGKVPLFCFESNYYFSQIKAKKFNNQYFTTFFLDGEVGGWVVERKI